MSWPDAPITVRVPATSANLGPGFDSLGLALTLHDVVEARVTAGGLDIKVSGAGEDTAAAGEDHLVVQAMRAGFDATGGQPPGIGLRCVNVIPHGYGLGSSAGAIVAGLLAARALAPGGRAMTDADVLHLATRLEGHPDNVAACLTGGLTIAWATPSGARTARLQPVCGLETVVFIPERSLSTAQTRLLLPAAVPHADAAANSARAALLIAGLTVEPALLLAGTEDLLHQPYRAPAMPASVGLIGRLRAAGVPAVVSGAGPSVLALTVPGVHPGPEACAAIAAETGVTWQITPLRADLTGATVGPS